MTTQVEQYDPYTVSSLGTVTLGRIPALYDRDTTLFNNRTVHISAPDITDYIRSDILRRGNKKKLSDVSARFLLILLKFPFE